jgi:hypothetical protein
MGSEKEMEPSFTCEGLAVPQLNPGYDPLLGGI